MKKSKDIRLYNVLFPIWFLYFFPTAVWFFLLPLNFAIDSLVLCLAARWQKVEKWGQLWKKAIWKVWIIGFLCDFLGSLLIWGLTLLIWGPLELDWNLILFPGTTLVALPGVALAGVLIYVLNRKLSFRTCALTEGQIKKLSLVLAIATAPYTMLYPLYG